jgi:hypothetical protein
VRQYPLAAADAAAQLVHGGQAVAVRILHDDDAGVGYVHPHRHPGAPRCRRMHFVGCHFNARKEGFKMRVDDVDGNMYCSPLCGMHFNLETMVQNMCR